MDKKDGEEMECNFDEINTTGRIVSKYHNIDFLDYGGKRGYQTHISQIPRSASVLPLLLEKYDCYQTIDQLCQPWLQEMYDIDRNGPSKQVKRCQCLRWKKTFSDRDRRGQVFPCVRFTQRHRLHDLCHGTRFTT